MERKTHIILADLSDELLSFVHRSRSWSKHRKRLLVHLTYCNTLRKNINKGKYLLGFKSKTLSKKT